MDSEIPDSFPLYNSGVIIYADNNSLPKNKKSTTATRLFRQSDMAMNYINRALKILREEGPIELFMSIKDFSVGYIRRPLLELQKIKLKFKYGGSAPSPYDLIYVDPHNLLYHLWMPRTVANQHFLNIDSATARYGTFIIGGDWDEKPQNNKDKPPIYKMKFESRPLWKATVEHFEKGVDWKNTSSFNKSNKDVEWFQRVEELYDIIQSDGYKTQRELRNGYNKYFMPPEFDEIRVNIGRDGEIFFGDGRHRMCAIKILSIDAKIPVRVYVRHKQWQELRDEIHENGIPEGREELRDHPDLQDILE